MTQPATRLWEKEADLDAAVHRFTVGDDPTWDLHLVVWDCLGSAAHARTLQRAGLLTDGECAALLAGLAEISAQARAGRFAIPYELEDCHTAIEAALTQRDTTAGAKIHTGRSRNDQVATAMRLFMRHEAFRWQALLADFVTALLARAKTDGDAPMPGYTHLRPAMPSSIGQWLHALAEAALEQMRAVLDLLSRLDACPLGTGAGYGVPLPLDRAYTAALLGFTREQRSPMDVQNSRGRLEKYFVRVGADIAAILERACCDLLLWSTDEFGFVSLPEALTTGSSIMPQKRNPDVLELLRGRAAGLRGRLVELENLTTRLTSGYHRDLQLTKAPTICTALDIGQMLPIGARVIQAFILNRHRLRAAIPPELYATHAALDLVRSGTPFRAAYRQIADEIRNGRFDAERTVPWRDRGGEVAPQIWQEVADEAAALAAEAERERGRVDAALAALFNADA